MSAYASTQAHPLLAVVEDRGWIDRAICAAHPTLYFAPFGERPGTRRGREARAKHMCTQCPVQLGCRDAGRRTRESGIWSGQTEEARPKKNERSPGLRLAASDDASLPEPGWRVDRHTT